MNDLPHFFRLTQQQAENAYLPQDLLNEIMNKLRPHDLLIWKENMKCVNTQFKASVSIRKCDCGRPECEFARIYRLGPRGMILRYLTSRHQTSNHRTEQDYYILNFMNDGHSAPLPFYYWA